MMNRVCILSTPRTGSQLCENFIRDHIGAIALGEYFENWNRYQYSIIDGNMTLVERSTVNSHFNISDDYRDRLNTLKQANMSQPMVMRLFIMDRYNKEILRDIIQGLTDLNFSFISLQRSAYLDQLISYIIAIHHKVYLKNNVFGINSVIDTPITIDLPFTRKMFETLYPSIINFNKNIGTLLSEPIPKIEYSTIAEDLGKLYNTSFRTEGIKSIKGDPFDLVINRDELLLLLKDYNIPLNGK